LSEHIEDVADAQEGGIAEHHQRDQDGERDGNAIGLEKDAGAPFLRQ
jgi:hypothetical protein